MKLFSFLKTSKLHEILFYIFLFLIPIQTRILYAPEKAYISSYFDYQLAFFVYLTDIILFTSFVLWLIFDRPNKSELLNKIFWLILAFFLLILLWLFPVKRLDLGIYGTVKWLEMLILFVYIWQTFKKQVQFLVTLGILFSSAILQAILGIWQFHVQHSLGLNFLGEYIAPLGTSGLSTIDTVAGKFIRAYGTFPHPNIFGMFLVFGLILGIYLGIRVQRIGFRIIIHMANFLLILGIFISFSRIAWFSAFLVCLLLTAYCSLTKEKRKALAIVILAVVSCATILIAYQPFLRARGIESDSTSVLDRWTFNDIGLILIARNPILGVGTGNYVPVMDDQFVLQPWQHQPAHNIYIFIAAELGVFALLVLLLLFFQIFSNAKRAFWENQSLTFALMLAGIIFLAAGNFDHYFVTIQQGRLIFFTVLGLIAALPQLQSYEKSL